MPLEERISVIPGGVDLDVFKPSHSREGRARGGDLGLPLDRPIILTVRSWSNAWAFKTSLRR